MNSFVLNPDTSDNASSDVSSIDTQGDTYDSIPTQKKQHPITQEPLAIEVLQSSLEKERQRNSELASLVSRLKVCLSLLQHIH
jgi:hypothetical protein